MWNVTRADERAYSGGSYQFKKKGQQRGGNSWHPKSPTTLKRRQRLDVFFLKRQRENK